MEDMVWLSIGAVLGVGISLGIVGLPDFLNWLRKLTTAARSDSSHNGGDEK